MFDFASVCRAQAASALVGGALLLILPGPPLGLFGFPADPGTEALARMAGGFLWALGATLLGVREVTDVAARTRVCVGNAVCDGSLALLLSAYVGRGTLPPLAWVLAALFAANASSWLLALRASRAATP